MGAANKRGSEDARPELSSYRVAGGREAQLFAHRRSGKRISKAWPWLFILSNTAFSPIRVTQPWHRGGHSATQSSRKQRAEAHREDRGVAPEQPEAEAARDVPGVSR